jgi:hypothetical protein
MELKRLYARDKAGDFVLDKSQQPKVCAVQINTRPKNGIQHLSTNLVNQGIAQGWIVKDDTKLTILDARAIYKLDKAGEKVLDNNPDPDQRKYIVSGTELTGDDLHFKITLEPGTYCTHDGAKLPSDPTGQAARDYVAENFGETESPDPDWPHGYKVIHYFDCEVI